jgi:GntR family transcriptional regulator of arabinose operon
MKTEPKKLQPKYLRIKEALLHHLRTEHYQAGQQIPTEHVLTAQFKVSRATVRQALTELEHEGVLYKIQGSGSFFSGHIAAERKPSHLLGVVTPTLSFYIYPQIIQGITDVAQQKQYNVVLGSSSTSPGEDLGCIEQLLAKEIDGLIFEPSPDFQYSSDSKLLTLLKSLTIPVVFMGTAMNDANLSYISVDDVEGGTRATNYLIQAGHRRIACLYPSNLLAGQHRYQGYRKALEASGIEPDDRFEKAVTTFYSEETPAQTATLLNELLSLDDERPTAVFCFDDLIAVYCCQAIEEAGLTIPDDISVMSFDDSDLAFQPKVPLTGMVHPKYYQGKWAAELVIEKLEHPDQDFPRHHLITPTLAVRDSVKAI